MVDTQEKSLPGSVSSLPANGEKGFAKIAMLLDATGGLSLSQVCAVTGLEGSTIQNWVKRGWVAHPLGKKYEEVHVARILIINALKECIKLEHITLLMTYVNGAEDGSQQIIKESDLYNYLCDALFQLGYAEDLSQSGVESVVEAVIADYDNPAPYARFRIRKALSVMIYACVCTDVKRRTETMLDQVLHELEHPESIDEAEYSREVSAAPVIIKPAPETAKVEAEQERPKDSGETPRAPEETRKTVAQALREWDLANAETAQTEQEEEAVEEAPPAVSECDSESGDGGNDAQDAGQGQPPQRPWYFRRN